MHDYCSIVETSAGHLRDCTTLTQLRRRVATSNNTRLPTEGDRSVGWSVGRSVGLALFLPHSTSQPHDLSRARFATRLQNASSSLTSSGLTCMNFHRSYLARLPSVLTFRFSVTILNTSVFNASYRTYEKG